MAKNKRRYQKMKGRAPALGEHMGNKARYVTEPGNDEETDLLKGLFQQGSTATPLPTGSRQPPLDPIDVIREYGAQPTRTVEVSSTVVEVSYRVLTNVAQSFRIDAGLRGRKDILIANMSAQVIWWNTRPMIAALDGFPLGPISAVGNYDGGSISLDASSVVPFYALPGAAGNSALVVVETAR